MSRTDINAQAAKIFKTIELTIDGTDYDIEKIESDVLEDIIDSGSKPRKMREAFAALVGADKDIFKHTDSRVLTLAMRQITIETTEQLGKLDSKNVQKESAKPNQ